MTVSQKLGIPAESLTLGFGTVATILAVIVGGAFGAGMWFSSTASLVSSNTRLIESNTMQIRQNTKTIAGGLEQINYQIADLNDSMRRAAGDRWCATNMREWIDRTRTANPSLKLPPIDDLRSYPCQFGSRSETRAGGPR